ncbi:MAG TPA: Uma2 family endonuclease [Candidatus Kapabacteria bacterium]|nr:Uma2 family endonuclease [Candidatus Kapabacteria bacterium]
MEINSLTLKQRKTIADYQRLPEGTPIQLIDGEFIMSPSPVRKHQKLIGKLHLQLGELVESNKLGEVYIAPFDVHMSRNDVYQPDLLFVSNEHLDDIQEDGVHGPPDLVIEVLSRSTAGFDLLLKKDGYEKFGVKEYWVVDPMDKTIEVFINSPNGFVSSFAGKTGTACSSVLPEFCIDVIALFGAI